MKRPQGFDRGPSVPADVARARATRASRGRDSRRDVASPDAGRGSSSEARTPSAAVTEPIPILGTSDAPRGSRSRTRTDPNDVDRGDAGRDDAGRGGVGRDDAGPTGSDAGATTGARIPSPFRASRARRRYERDEVKRFTRRSRRRRAIWLGSIGTVLVVIAVTVSAALSPLMAVRTIDVVGTTRIDASAVRASLSSQLGRPLPLVDYGSVRKALDRYRLIRSYSTEAVPPGTLVVRIVERTPIGLLRAGSGYDLVDQAGVVISSTAVKPGGYPIITRVGKPGSAEAKASFAASAAVLAVLPSTLLPRVSAITASSAEDVTFTLDGKSVTWGGTEDTALKATVLAALLKAAPRAQAYDVSSPHAPVTR